MAEQKEISRKEEIINPEPKSIYLNIMKCLKKGKLPKDQFPRYYLCDCSIREKKIICEECMNKCHSKCYKKYRFNHIYNEDNNECDCENEGHQVDSNEDLEDHYENNIDTSNKEKCPYVNIMATNEALSKNKITYFSISFKRTEEDQSDDFTLCSICYKYCLHDPHNVFTFSVVEDKELQHCYCKNHVNENIHQEIVYKNYDLSKFFYNYNLNVLLKIRPEYLGNIQKCLKNVELVETEIDEFVELYHIFNHEYNNKFFIFDHLFEKDENLSKIKGILLGKSKEAPSLNKKSSNVNVSNTNEDKSVSKNSNQQSTKKAQENSLITKQFLFASAMVEYYLKEPFVKLCNFYSINVILNMNPIQRNNCLYKIKKMSRLNVHNEQNNIKFEKKAFYDEFFDMYLEIFKKCIDKYRNRKRKGIEHEFAEYIMPTFTKMCYFLVKYHVISDQKIDEYFQVLFNIISLFLSQNDTLFYLENDFNFSVYNIIKTILVTLIYISDMNIMEKIKDNSLVEKALDIFKEDDITYAYLSTRTEVIYKVFLCLINRISKTDLDLSKTIDKKIDNFHYYVEKILEMSIGDHGFYLANIQNLCLLPNSSFNHNIINEDPDNFIFNFSNRISEMNNKCYSNEYDVKLMYVIIKEFNDTYLNKLGLYNIVEELMSKNERKYKFVSTIKKLAKEINKGKDTTAKGFDKNEIKDKTLHRMQIIVKYSSIFGRFNHFFTIYHDLQAQDKSLKGIAIDNETEDLMDIEKHRLLLFFYLMVHKNNENLCLLMNFKPKCFLYFFKEGKPSIFFFLKKIIKMFFESKNNYVFDNFDFFIKIIREVIKEIKKALEMQKKIKLNKAILNETSSKQVDKNEYFNQDESDDECYEDEITNRKDFYYSLNKSLKFFILICRKISTKNIRVLDLMKNIKCLIDDLKFSKEKIISFMKQSIENEEGNIKTENSKIALI